MKFSERMKLAEEYEKWLKYKNRTGEGDGIKIKDNAFNVITYLDNNGYIDDTRD